jgi:hypothetical protein
MQGFISLKNCKKMDFFCTPKVRFSLFIAKILSFLQLRKRQRRDFSVFQKIIYLSLFFIRQIRLFVFIFYTSKFDFVSILLRFKFNYLPLLPTRQNLIICLYFLSFRIQILPFFKSSKFLFLQRFKNFRNSPKTFYFPVF